MEVTIRARQELEELRVLRDGLVVIRQYDWAAHVEILSRVAAVWVAQRAGQYAEALQHSAQEGKGCALRRHSRARGGTALRTSFSPDTQLKSN